MMGAKCDIIVVRCLIPDVFTIKISQRHQGRGVLTGIQTDPCRVAIGIDHVTMERCPNRRDIIEKPVIKRVDMPIRIGKFAPAIIQFCGNVVWNIGPRMGQSQNDGTIAVPDFNRIALGHALPPTTKPESFAAETRLPLVTSSAAFARSGAM